MRCVLLEEGVGDVGITAVCLRDGDGKGEDGD